MASFKPDYPTGTEKCRCLVLLNGRGALPSLLAMLLAKSACKEKVRKNPFVSDLQANLGYSSYEPSRQGRFYRFYRGPSVPSPTLHCSGVRHIRTSGNEPSGRIRSCSKSESGMSPLGQMLGRFRSQALISLSNPKKYPESRICLGCH